jgi:hypothetical protein
MHELLIHTFSDHVAIGAQLSPHGLILDWWRRVEWAEADFLRSAGLPCPYGRRIANLSLPGIHGLGRI